MSLSKGNDRNFAKRGPPTQPEPDPFDPSLYKLEGDELEFFKTTTGLDDEEKLREHIVAVTEKAYKIFPYPCIRSFNFLKLELARNDTYSTILDQVRRTKDPIFVDIGCCFGVDMRKLAIDGFPSKRIVGLDLEIAFWDLGHQLFLDDQTKFPAPFVAGDVLTDETLKLVPPIYRDNGTPAPRRPSDSELSKLTSLNPLQHKTTAVHAGALFHFFSEEQQLLLAKKFAGLISPEPGSVISGYQLTLLPGQTLEGWAGKLFLHTQTSWAKMWSSVLKSGSYRQNSVLRNVGYPGIPDLHMIVWSVVRV